MRWLLLLSKFNFIISYLPGKKNERADALSRREQDIPANSDERLEYRMKRLIDPKIIITPGDRTITCKANNTILDIAVSSQEEPLSETEGASTSHGEPLMELWNSAEGTDTSYQAMVKAVQEGERTFPKDLGVKVSMSDCELNEDRKLMFRGRRWVPESEELRTKLL